MARQRYHVTKKIDAGGMAEIYLGEAESIEGIKRKVAIKRVLPNLNKNAKFIQMFLDEARLSMQLAHANIVQVFDVGEAGGTYFIVMEFVEGYNLRKLFQRTVEVGYRIPVEIACFITMEACKGLGFAHSKTDSDGQHLHIVHRDLSPPNIMVSKSGEVKVTDFGLAKAMTQLTVTDPGVVKGKFSYLSPEATEGLAVDHRADIFAAGIVLWEMLANRRLFLGKTDMDTVELVKQAKIPPLSKFNSQVTPEFETIVNRSLAKDPRKRFLSAKEFGEALANYLFSSNLKVTGYDLASMLQRVYSEDAHAETPEERIHTLIQDEILSLAMLGYNGSTDTDASQAISPERLQVGVSGMDLSQFWSSGMVGGGAPEVAAKTSTEELIETLEPRIMVPSVQESGSKTGLIVGVITILALIGAAVAYYLLGT